MLEFKVLGKGEECYELACMVLKVSYNEDIPVKLVRTADNDDIVGHGVVITPALVLNGHLAFSGNMPTIEEIKALFE